MSDIIAELKKIQEELHTISGVHDLSIGWEKLRRWKERSVASSGRRVTSSLRDA